MEALQIGENGANIQTIGLIQTVEKRGKLP